MNNIFLISALDILFRTTIVYLVLLVGLRMAGKREIGQMTVFDLVVLLLISNAVQNAMVGSNDSLLGGLLAAVALLLLNFLVATLRLRVPRLRKFVEGSPTLLVLHGSILSRNLEKEGIDEEDLQTAFRTHGVLQVDEVEMAVLEIDGSISVIPVNGGAKPVKRVGFETTIMPRHILLVDDDPLMRRSLAFNLEQAGYRVSPLGNAEDALALARRDSADLVLLDIGLPGMDGLDALRQFKSQFNVPVIFLTARRRNLDEVLGLELGADDYLTKPFDVDVLLAHIKAVLRRIEHPGQPASPAASLSVGDLLIDPFTHTVTLTGQPVLLSPREFDLLYTLALEPNRAIAVAELLERVWGAEFVGQPQVVYVHVRWLREKLEANPQNPLRIISIRGVGYKYQPQGVRVPTGGG